MQVVDAFADAHKVNLDTEFLSHSDYHAALGRAVQFGDDQAVAADRFGEDPDLREGILAGVASSKNKDTFNTGLRFVMLALWDEFLKADQAVNEERNIIMLDRDNRGAAASGINIANSLIALLAFYDTIYSCASAHPAS